MVKNTVFLYNDLSSNYPLSMSKIKRKNNKKEGGSINATFFCYLQYILYTFIFYYYINKTYLFYQQSNKTLHSYTTFWIPHKTHDFIHYFFFSVSHNSEN